jgi:Xaa-Pro aminopeptidase
MIPLDPLTDIPAQAFAARRVATFDALGHGVMVLPAAQPLFRSRDTEIRYRPDSELFYLTGVTEPGAVAVLVGGADRRFLLFVPERDADAERWSGPRLGTNAAEERFGADETHPVSDLGPLLPALLREGDVIHARLGRAEDLDRAVFDALRHARARGAREGSGPRAVIDPGEILDELRLHKDEHEIARIRRAVSLTVEGHLAGISLARPGVGEWAVEASVNAAFREGGAEGAGFETIVGSGPNGCVLHYVENRRTLEDGDLVLLDAGAEVGLYHGDVTRTFPANGRFTSEQRAVYDVVERARVSALEAANPGATISSVHDAVVRVLLEGLVDLGVLTGAVDALVADEAHRVYYPHQTSHWLGLDVHDPGDYVRGGADRCLAPGMVFTVEPGLYFPLGLGGSAAPYEGIAVRIEDDLLMRADAVENLSAQLPTDADAMEALARGEG